MSNSDGSISGVSVVIPCYNDTEYIGNAIESCLSQTVSPSEIIVVDDDSSDEIDPVLAPYEDAITLVRHETNQGAAAARNTGVRESSGSLVAFLDADDEWLPHKLERQLQELNASPSLDMVYTGFYAVNLDGSIRRVVEPLSTNEDFLEKMFVSGGAILPSSVLIRRRCFEDIGGFNEGLKVGHDRELWLRIGGEYRVECINEPLLKRRMRPDSLASDYEEKYRCEQRTTERLVEQYPRLERLVSEREANLLYNRSSFFLCNGEVAKARRSAVNSLRLNRRRYDALVVFVISLLGSRLAPRGWQYVRDFRSQLNRWLKR